ncbi:MAG: glutamate formimidoyltransferase [Candidatus Marinimicrobia bacterium]|nr:glutamate formimidoyltransferase [Candidatus Neomarinimicrobiota bacterium]
MNTLIECVPNFSEGRDLSKIDQITAAIKAVAGVTLLDVDPGADTNRTVVTFVGSVSAVEEAAFQAIKKAAEVIDMRQHHGAHGRMGATDVCPFIPVSGADIADCIALSERVGERVGHELGIPVYLYEHSARIPERRNLAVVRSGEYEALAEKLTQPRWKPDFGPAEFKPTAGATVMGCREFLIAYNINLNTRDKRLATDIAFELREKGRSCRKSNPDSPNLLDGSIIRYADGEYPCAFCDYSGATTADIIAHNRSEHDHDLEATWKENGYDPNKLNKKPVKRPGLFKDVKAVGWYIDTYKRAQISINFTNYKVATIPAVFDAACRLADERGIRVTGSELVGLIPLEALLMAGRHYLQKQGRTIGIPEADLVDMAVQSLGLNDVTPFVAEEKIVDYAVSLAPRDLINRTVTGFITETSTNSPAPGGGSVAALAGGLGAALASMVSALTHEKKGFEKTRSEMEEIGVKAQQIKDRLLYLVDEDTIAFNKVMDANRLPSESTEEQEGKAAAQLAAAKYAIDVPAEVAELSLAVMQLAKLLVAKGNPNSVSDAGVAGEVGAAAVNGACLNVLINLPGVTVDPDYVAAMRTKVEQLTTAADELRRAIFSATRQVIEG